jgi:hypothetical protein
VLAAVAALAAGLLAGRDDEQTARAAELAPADARLWVRVDAGDEELWALARRFPTLRRLIGPEQEVREWIGDEAALALVPEPLVIAAVEDAGAARRFIERRRLRAELVGDFLVAGPRRDGPSLADDPAYRAAGEADLYVPAGSAPLLGDFEAIAATLAPEEGGLRVVARVRRPPAEEFVPALVGRVPASAAAYLALPGADAFVALAGAAGASGTVDAVRGGLAELADLDLDRDLLGPLSGEAGVTITARGETPIVTLTARTANPAHTAEALAALQGPLAERLGSPGFQPSGGGFTMPVTPQLQPTYALSGNVLVASTAESGLEQLRAAQPGVAQELALQAVLDESGARVEALGFLDLRQLLALGERTGLTAGPGFPAVRDDLERVRAAGAVVRREESDSTAELFLEIP